MGGGGEEIGQGRDWNETGRCVVLLRLILQCNYAFMLFLCIGSNIYLLDFITYTLYPLNTYTFFFGKGTMHTLHFTAVTQVHLYM
jgi:hypothetical protein